MNGEGDTLGRIAHHLALCATPLREAVRDAESFRRLMHRLGWLVESDSVPPAWERLGALIDAALTTLDTLGPEPEAPEILRALAGAGDVYRALGAVAEAPPGVDRGEFLAETGDRLLELLLVDYVALAAPKLSTALEMVGAIQHEFHQATPTRPAFTRSRLDLGELVGAVANPSSVPRRVYGWGTPELDVALILDHVLELAVALELPVRRAFFDDETRLRFQPGVRWPVAGRGRDQLYLPVLQGLVAGVPAEAGLVLMGLLEESGELPGLILQPYAPAEVGAEAPIDDHLRLVVRGGSDLTEALGLVLRPGGVSIRYPLRPDAALPAAGFRMAVVYSPDQPQVIVGRATGTRLEIGSATLSLELAQRDGAVEARAALACEGLAAVISAGDVDGFVGSLVGERDLRVPIPLEVVWSSRTGFGFGAGAGLEFGFNPHLDMGPVTVDQVDVALRATAGTDSPGELVARAGVAISGRLGPVGFSVAGMGVGLRVTFAEGNAGPFDVAVGFVAPDGVGIVVDGGPVVGGGFLRFEPDQGRYSGFVQLEVAGLAVKAVGILTTRLPDGSKGFSLLLVISTEFPPVQLGFGFTLNGIGGLIAINRSAAVDVLRAGLSTGTLDAVLFPDDPVRDAPRLLSDLGTAFPPTPDRHVFGPAALIAWGTPTLMTAKVAILLELPAPVRLIILGQIRCLLPTEDHALIVLKMDILGVLDFERGELSVQASLHDSRLLTFALSGDMALVSRWGTDPTFALSLGGFHPRFEPPAGFPALRRLQVDLGGSSNPRLTLDAYLAVTSNTVQFGARLELRARISEARLRGYLAFDALVVLSPFSFVVDIAGGVEVSVLGTELFGVHLEFTLWGPTPWRAKGKATVKVLFVRVRIRFDETWGDPRPVELPPTDPWAEGLAPALADPRNWSGRLPADADMVVTLRDTLAVPGTVRVDPTGFLELRQRIVPLDLEISRFAGRDLQTPVTFHISRVHRRNHDLAYTAVTDAFAPGAVLSGGSEEEQISRPAFEQHTAGLRAGSQDLSFSDPLRRDLDYETEILDRDQPSWRRPGKDLLSANLAAALLHHRTALKTMTNRGLKRFPPPEPDPAVVCREPGWVIATTDDLRPRHDLLAGGVPHTVANQVLARYLGRHPLDGGRLQVIPIHEAQP